MLRGPFLRATIPQSFELMITKHHFKVVSLVVSPLNGSEARVDPDKNLPAFLKCSYHILTSSVIF